MFCIRVLLKREHGATECVCDYGLHVSWKIEKVPWKSHGFFKLYTCMNPDSLITFLSLAREVNCTVRFMSLSSSCLEQLA